MGGELSSLPFFFGPEIKSLINSYMKHKHHIIPRHAGGSDDPSNIVELTPEEHALAHKKLFEKHGRIQDKIAWLGISKQIGKEEAINMSKRVPKSFRTDEHRAKLSKALKGKKPSEANRLAVIAANSNRAPVNKGVPMSEEQKRKISKAQKGRVHSEETKRRMSESIKNHWERRRRMKD